MGVGATNKRKGSTAERYYAKVFRDLGFTFCETSRFVSKKHDNAKIDLMYIPFNVQIKAGIQKSMSPGKELLLMSSCIATMFPPGDEVFTKPNILFHYKQGTPGRKREPESEMVYMSFEQFKRFQVKDEHLHYLFIKTHKFDSSSEYKTMVSMTFEYFKENIILKQYK